MPEQTFRKLLSSVHACALCEDELVDGVRPVLQVHPTAKILIAGQAPGVKVHATGIPFDDPSGNRLRDWMGIDHVTFYDESCIAILPMGFCYPGRGKSGDLPPQAICATSWRQKLLAELPDIQLTLVIGQYAQAWHLPTQRKTLTETVRSWTEFGDAIIPLPHPSPRNNVWLKRNPWFETDVIPELRNRVANALQ